MKKVITLIFFVIFCYIYTPFVYAEDFSLEVSPQIITVYESSKKQEIPIHVLNPSNDIQTFFIGIKPFIVRSDKKHNDIEYTDSSIENDYRLASLTVLDNGETITEITLSPKQDRSLTLVVNPTDTTLANDTYATLFFISKSKKVVQNSLTDEIIAESYIQGGIGIHLLFTSHNNNTDIKIVNFTSPQFAEHGPVSFDAEVKNTTPHLFYGDASLQITNVFGQAIGNIDIPKLLVLSNATKTLSSGTDPKTIVWNEEILFGPYTATLSLYDEQMRPIAITQIHFFAFPVKAGIAISLVIVIIVTIFTAAQYKRKFLE